MLFLLFGSSVGEKRTGKEVLASYQKIIDGGLQSEGDNCTSDFYKNQAVLSGYVLGLLNKTESSEFTKDELEDVNEELVKNNEQMCSIRKELVCVVLHGQIFSGNCRKCEEMPFKERTRDDSERLKDYCQEAKVIAEYLQNPPQKPRSSSSTPVHRPVKMDH